MKSKIITLFVFCILVLCHSSVAQDISIYKGTWELEQITMDLFEMSKLANEYLDDEYKIDNKLKMYSYSALVYYYLYDMKINFYGDGTLCIYTLSGDYKGMWKYMNGYYVVYVQLDYFGKVANIILKTTAINRLEIIDGDNFFKKYRKSVNSLLFIKRDNT